MAFGDKLFQLAQGIVGNEQKRKQLELQEKANDNQVKQAESSLAMRQKELTAREGFLKVQTEQLQAKIEFDADPQVAAQRTAETANLTARTNKLIAETEEIEKGKAPSQRAQSVTEGIALGKNRERLVGLAKKARIDQLYENLLLGSEAGVPNVPLGVNAQKILDGISKLGIRTMDGLEAAIEGNAAAQERAARERISPANQQKKIAALEVDRLAMIQARNESFKVWSRDVDFGEFEKIAGGSREDVASMFFNGRPAGSNKLDIWGQSIFGGRNNEFLDIALTASRNGDNGLMEGFIRMMPAELLDADGRLTDDGQLKLSRLFFSEGIPISQGRALTNSFNSTR